MKSVIIYTTPTCTYCHLLKDWFKQNNVVYAEYDLSQDAVKRDEIVKKTGQMAVPIVEIGNDIVIGFDKSKLSELLGL